MTPSPFLTIAIPTWRRAAALERQLELVLGGLPNRDVEVLVGDNGSDDATPAVIEAAAARDQRVRSYRNPVNLGCDANYLRLIEWARGEWIWLLGDDEPLDPALLPSLHAALAAEVHDAVHLVPRSLRSMAPDGAPVVSIDSILAQAYCLTALQAVSTVVVRRRAALPHLIDGYRVAGHLHAYTGVVVAMLRAGASLRVLDLPVLTSYGNLADRRWPSIRGQLGAWWTLHRSFPVAQRPEVDRREARDRLPETLRALQQAAERGTEPLDPDELAMLVLLVPPEQRAGVHAFCQGALAVAAQRRAGAAGEAAAY